MTTHEDVLLVCPRASLPGHYWPCAEATAAALADRQVSVRILAPGAPQDTSLEGRPHVHIDRCVRTMRVAAHTRAVLTLFCTAIAAWRAMTRGLRVVHVINGQQTAVALMTLLLPGKTIVNNLYGFPEGDGFIAALPTWKARLRYWLYRRAAATRRLWVVVETAVLREAYTPLYGERVVEIPYSLAEPALEIDAATARRELGLPAERFIFLVFGTHREGKDYATVVRAMQQLADDAVLLFVGKLISDNDPRRHAAVLPTENVQHIEGFVSERTMALAFRAADVVILPYERDFERGSGVLMEALRYRRPSLATDGGHLRTFVQQHQTGVLYPSGDAESLAAAMRALQQPGATAAFTPALERAFDQFSWKRTVSRYLDLYGWRAARERP